MRSEFATAQRVILGLGTAAELQDLLRGTGRRALLVTSAGAARRGGPAAQLAESLARGGLVAAQALARREPTLLDALAAAQAARDSACDVVVGLGGGSALDLAKAAAALAANPGDPLRFIEVIGRGAPLENPALPLIALPTTAGAGSEATRNAVIADAEARTKASIRHPSMLPRLALVDAELTLDNPPPITASCGMDAIAQLLEAYVSVRANVLTDGMCLEGLTLAGTALPRAYRDGADREAREAMSAASLMSGIALANAGLGIVHGISAPLGGSFPVPHGAACAALLPAAVAVNIRALRRADPGHAGLRRYARAAQALGCAGTNDAALLDALPGWLAEIGGALAIPRLRSYGVEHSDLRDLAERALRASSTKGNPIALDRDEVEQIIGSAL